MFPTPKWKEDMARLEAINAELLAALEELAVLGEEGMPPYYTQWIAFHDKAAQVARAAIARAKAEDYER